jgi:flagellar hook assembly protein FlgD
MHRFILATAVLLLAPATALAVTTQQAQPPTISLTASGGVPRCTKLPYTIKSLRHKVILRISRSTKSTARAVKHTRLRDVKAGKHTFGWCGKTDLGKPVKPGVYFWRVGATQKAGAPVKWSQFRHVNVKA